MYSIFESIYKTVRIIGIHLRKIIGSSISYVLRSIEVILCLRKKPYKTHTFPRKNPMCEYYHNKLKFKKSYA